MTRPSVHLPTVLGRLRSDRALLVLSGLVVAVTTALGAAAGPLAAHAADRAVVAAVRDAGDRATVVASLRAWDDVPGDDAAVDDSAAEVRQDAERVQDSLPARLDAVLRPGVATVTTTPLQLLDGGPGRYVQLAFVASADGGPSLTWTSGREPRATRAPRPGVVRVALSDAAAEALDLRVGDVVPARDERGRDVTVRVAGTFRPDRADDPAWQVAPLALAPTTGAAGDGQRTAATALVTAAALPDLRRALPGDALGRRVVFVPEPAQLTWSAAPGLEQTVVALQSGAAGAVGATRWDTVLDAVLRDVRAEVASARGQAQVLLAGLLAVASLVLVLAGQLLVGRRAQALGTARERGASLPGLALELVLESVLVATAGAAVGLVTVRVLAGDAGWQWSLPVVLVASVSPPLLGAASAAAATRRDRVPANRSARRSRARAAAGLRVLVEVVLVAVAALTWVALLQRGVVGSDGTGGDATAAGAVVWVSAAASLLLLRLVPALLPSVLAGTRRLAGGVPLFVAARLSSSAGRVLPTAAVVVGVAQVVLGSALVTTLHDGQAAGARAAVGGDVRLDVRPDPAVGRVADRVAPSPGVRAVAAARVEDGVRVSGSGGSTLVRLVVADADDLARVLAGSGLASDDVAGLARDTATDPTRVPALLAGGAEVVGAVPGLDWDGVRIPLTEAGEAPDVGATSGPVVVVDAESFARAGAAAAPDTVWAVGPGASAAVRAAADREGVSGSLVTYERELALRRDAPMPSAISDLAVATCVLVQLLLLLVVALAAASDAPERRSSAGRLRALGLPHRDLARVVVGDLVVPVALASVLGAAVGAVCAHLALGSLGLERLTSTPRPPSAVVPWWSVAPVLVLVCGAALLAVLESRRVRATPLARLMRS